MPVVFGHYAWLKEWQNERVESAGSGLFIAPTIGLGTKHVSKSFEKLDDRIEAAQRRIPIFADRYTARPVVTQFAGLVYQAPKVRMPEEKDIPYWSVYSDWASHDTDITVLQVAPTSPAAHNAASAAIDYFEWQLLPPERGSNVDVFGFPDAKITAGDGLHMQNIQLRSETVRVVAVFDVLHAHGFTAFPGFQVDRELAHGFSGGPVFYNGRLVGIFSGPDYVAALWPLLLHEYPLRDENLDDNVKSGKMNNPLSMRPLAELFTTKMIVANDYDAVEGRARRLPCAEALDRSAVDTRCDKLHAVLVR